MKQSRKKLNPVEAAQAAGWVWAMVWINTDMESILANEAPPIWYGGTRDLCLAQGIEHE